MRNLLIISCAFLLVGCTRLNVSLSQLPVHVNDQLDLNVSLKIPPETAEHIGTVRLGLYKFKIHLGNAIVKYAQFSINEKISNDFDNKLKIYVEHYVIRDLIADLSLQFVLTNKGKIIFDESYAAEGNAYSAYFGVWGVPPMLRNTTDDAVSGVFNQFIEDLKTYKNDWHFKNIFIEE